MSTSAPKDRIPPGLLLGLVGLGVGSALIWLGWGEASRGSDRGELEAQLVLGGPAVVLAALAVAIAGARDLEERLPAAKRGAAMLIGTGLWLLEGYEVGEVVRTHLFDPVSKLGGHEMMVWLRRLGLVGALLVAGGVLGLGRALPRVRGLAVPLVGLAILSQPTVGVLEWAYRTSGGGSTFFVVFAAAELGFAALVLVALREIVRVDGQVTARPWQRAADGYFQAGSALTARIAMVVLGVAFALFAVVTRSPEVLKVWLYVVPLGIVAVTLGFVAAVLRAATDDDADAPVVRLYLAAGLTTFAAVVTAIQTMVVYKGGDVLAVMRVLDVATPAATLGGFLCLISAIGTVAERTRLTVTREGTVRTGLLVAAVSTAAVLVQQWFAHEVAGGTAKDAGVFALAALITGIAGVVAILQVARLCQRISGDLHTAREGAALPVAQVRVPEPDDDIDL